MEHTENFQSPYFENFKNICNFLYEKIYIISLIK